MQLPSEPKGRTSKSSKPAFLWDKAKYILGVDSEGNPYKDKNNRNPYFEGSIALHHKLLDGVDDPCAKAVLKFFDCWKPSQAKEHPALKEYLNCILSGEFMVFRYDGNFVHDNPLIKQAWQDYYSKEEEGPEMVCLVTGKKGPVERIHPAIKGVKDAKPKAALVSFNANAFCSYGKEQNINAPISKYAAFAYTSALNYLIQDSVHRPYHIGKTTVVCWAEGGEPAFQSAFGAFAFNEESSDSEKIRYTAQDLRCMLEQLSGGRSVSFEETLLDPHRPFYILGLAPNDARLSVQFFLHDSFSELLKNVQEHYQRLEIVKPSYDRFDTLPPNKLLEETINQESLDTTVPPNMASAVMRSILMNEPYPATLLHGALLRIRAEREVTRGRAAIIKAYYLKRPHPDIPKEVLTVSLNPDSTNIYYTLGRLFSVLEAVQIAASNKDSNTKDIKSTIKDRYFNAASSMPSHIFPILLNLSQKHLRKLEDGHRVYYEKQITELASILPEMFPSRLSLPQQGAFQLGYYHQTQKQYEKKEEIKNV